MIAVAAAETRSDPLAAAAVMSPEMKNHQATIPQATWSNCSFNGRLCYVCSQRLWMVRLQLVLRRGVVRNNGLRVRIAGSIEFNTA